MNMKKILIFISVILFSKITIGMEGPDFSSLYELARVADLAHYPNKFRDIGTNNESDGNVGMPEQFVEISLYFKEGEYQLSGEIGNDIEVVNAIVDLTSSDVYSAEVIELDDSIEDVQQHQEILYGPAVKKRKLEKGNQDKSFEDDSLSEFNKYYCKYCNKSFLRKGNLVNHLRKHTGEVLNPCTICKKSFSSVAALNLHQRVHTGYKPYVCYECNKAFAWLSNFKKHKCNKQ